MWWIYLTTLLYLDWLFQGVHFLFTLSDQLVSSLFKNIKNVPPPPVCFQEMSMSSRESVTTQLSVSTVPHEESVLEMYFNLLSQTNFEKAKDLVVSAVHIHTNAFHHVDIGA